MFQDGIAIRRAFVWAWKSIAPLGLFYDLRSHRSEIKIGTREQISSAYCDLLQFILGYPWLRDSHGKTNMPLAEPPPKAPISWLPATLQ